ncbi:MAG: hypothetical protein JO161_10860 [Planctomycetaceae bacterium]|nr:hypothetical protein [Planctomycetaceae bacterium]
MRLRPESLAVTKLDLFFHDVPLAPATGFVYKYGQSIALVSNWHVFSGRHPLTGSPGDPRGYCPNRVEFSLSLSDTEKGSVLFRSQDAPLVAADGQSLWWQHQGYPDQDGKPRIVDIGVLELNERISDFEVIREQISTLNAHVIVNTDAAGTAISFEYGYTRVAAEVFILGYPRGLTKQGVLPVWKRGSIASEPLFAVMDNAPAMFVDAVTRDGMSGSPVLYFGNEITDVLGRSRGLSRQGGTWLVGVYAGREGVTKDENEMVLGRVWHRRLLDEIFYQRVPGGLPAVVPDPGSFREATRDL